MARTAIQKSLGQPTKGKSHSVAAVVARRQIDTRARGRDEEANTAELRAECEELRRRMALVPRATQSAAIQISELEKALLGIRKARDSALAHIHALTARATEAEARVQELTGDNDHLQGESDRQLASMAAARNESEELRGLLEAKDRWHAEAMAKLESELQESKLRPIENATEVRLTNQLTAAREKVTALEAFFERVQQQQKTANATLVESLIKLKRDYAASQEKLEILRGQFERERADHAQVREAYEQANRHLSHLENIAAERLSEGNDPLEAKRLRQQNAELTEQLNRARDDARLAWSLAQRAKNSAEDGGDGDETEYDGTADDDIPTPLEGDEARAVLDDMRETLGVALAAPDPQEFLGIFGKQLQSFGRRALCAGSMAAHRLAGISGDVVKWMCANGPKLATMQRPLEYALDIQREISASADARVHADIAEAEVYVVDDDLDNCDCIAMSLDKHGLRTHYASKAAMALEHLTRQSCDLIILDVDLGSTNGFDLHTEIRKVPRHRFTPILFLSALSSAEARVAELKGNRDTFLAKPYSLAGLNLTVLSLIVSGRLPRV